MQGITLNTWHPENWRDYERDIVWVLAECLIQMGRQPDYAKHAYNVIFSNFQSHCTKYRAGYHLGLCKRNPEDVISQAYQIAIIRSVLDGLTWSFSAEDAAEFCDEATVRACFGALDAIPDERYLDTYLYCYDLMFEWGATQDA